MEPTVADCIAQTLRREGVERCFLLTGSDQALWIALDAHGIDLVLARSEASAVYMADGYAQRAGGVAVTYGQAGPGAANVAAALADPYWSRTPLVAITSAPSADTRYRSNYQELDAGPMLGAVTAAAFDVPRPERVRDLLPRAFAVARRSGPVSVAIPRDFFAAPAGPDDGLPAPAPEPVGTPRPDPAAVARAADEIAAMSRPLIVAGTGARRARAGDALRALASRLRAPVATSPGGKGVVGEDEPGAVGVVGRYASTLAGEVARDADGYLVVGSRLGGMVSDGYRLPRPGVPVVHIDRDAAALAGQPAAGVRVEADVVAGLEALAAAARPHPEAKRWHDEVVARRARWERGVAALPAHSDQGTLRPHAVFGALNAAADRLTLVADTGAMAAWSSALFRPGHPDGYFRANGSLGWALPAALGVQAAEAARRVVCLTGDGGLGYHVGDLETARRRGLPVIVVVLNNSCLGFEYHEQQHLWDGCVVPSVNDLVDIDHAEVAAAYGWAGARVRTLAGFEAALADALADPGRPWLLDVVIDREDAPPVTSLDRALRRVV